MKFRLDFILNSSSSGYVTIFIELENGEIIKDGFVGGAFIELEEKAKSKAMNIIKASKNGDDIYKLFQIMCRYKNGFKEFLSEKSINKIENIQDFKEIKSIILTEETIYDSKPFSYHTTIGYRKGQTKIDHNFYIKEDETLVNSFKEYENFDLFKNDEIDKEDDNYNNPNKEKIYVYEEELAKNKEIGLQYYSETKYEKGIKVLVPFGKDGSKATDLSIREDYLEKYEEFSNKNYFIMKE